MQVADRHLKFAAVVYIIRGGFVLIQLPARKLVKLAPDVYNIVLVWPVLAVNLLNDFAIFVGDIVGRRDIVFLRKDGPLVSETGVIFKVLQSSPFVVDRIPAGICKGTEICTATGSRNSTEPEISQNITVDQILAVKHHFMIGVRRYFPSICS